MAAAARPGGGGGGGSGGRAAAAAAAAAAATAAAATPPPRLLTGLVLLAAATAVHAVLTLLAPLVPLLLDAVGAAAAVAARRAVARRRAPPPHPPRRPRRLAWSRPAAAVATAAAVPPPGPDAVDGGACAGAAAAAPGGGGGGGSGDPPPPPPHLSAVSFCGCAWLLPYHVGAAAALDGARLLGPTTTYLGTSCGALLAAALAVGVDPAAVSAAIDAGSATVRGGVLGPAGRMSRLVRGALDGVLPADAAARATGRLGVAVSRVGATGVVPVVVTGWADRGELVDCLLASCFIPVYYEGVPRRRRGAVWVDGGVTNNLPVYGEMRPPGGGVDGGDTLTVSPFVGGGTVCPAPGAVPFVGAHRLFPNTGGGWRRSRRGGATTRGGWWPRCGRRRRPTRGGSAPGRGGGPSPRATLSGGNGGFVCAIVPSPC
ncbi:hypothetical protein BU14_1180s0003 [Porphyra umbilicalis]|uniref:PNPLA domain-containing protein n=1 Tax=Porphyra umbilicalis TaxID=2786 RepID=A0A1X6NMF1_PORUM|nr:hypothetical protein BU14_1180s0003 [Porphyra umbilicalis]|eukprot:OSX69767.1 hypothetical protein BU14_1180s0003 [Porphyra umbilicalis]